MSTPISTRAISGRAPRTRTARSPGRSRRCAGIAAPHWTADDIRARFEFGLRCALAHGTVAIRTHLDSPAPHHRTVWPVFRELRAEWAERIALQAVALVTWDDLDGRHDHELADLVAESGGVFGCVPHMVPDIDARLDRVFALAAERGLDLDFHVDETGDARACSLRHVAEAALRNRFRGQVLCGHCCSLALQDSADAERTLDLVSEAGIAVVSLPMCNLYLMNRVPGRTPRWRGVTLLHEMAARGIPVALASDNCRDPFYAYGDHDLVEVFREGARIAHLDRPVGVWPAAVTRTPAEIMGLRRCRRHPGRRPGRSGAVPGARTTASCWRVPSATGSCCARAVRSPPRCPTIASWTACCQAGARA